jgi:DNA-directed RNA polymerase sigma subunit (sigma70/sigma32)
MANPTNPHHFMTYSEVAEVLGVSRQTVRITEAKALAKLRRNPLLKQHFLDHISSSSESRSQDHVPSV